MLTTYTFENANLMLVALLVLWFGRMLNQHCRWLDNHNIPIAVSGGLSCAVLTGLLYLSLDVKVYFDMQLRDIFLLGFFSSIGLAAKFKNLIAGGKILVTLLLCCLCLLIVQDVIGIGLSVFFTDKPAYGLFAGSISFAGGHGTAIAWGEYMEPLGLKGAADLGIAAATIGLVAGGILGGLVTGRLIRKHKIAKPQPQPMRYKVATETDLEEKTPTPVEAVFSTLFCLTLCVSVGHNLNALLLQYDFQLPEFLTALMVGVMLTNLTDVIGRPLNNRAINNAGEVCLHLFLVMSLMSVQFWTLGQVIAPLLLILAAQMIAVTLIATYIVFHVTGRDYNAAVICSGFIGLGMGATPVAMANMQAVTGRFGPAPKAFIVVPLVGAFFIDLSNALVIKIFGLIPFVQQGLQLQ